MVAILSCDGSPTCGVTITSYDKNWGGSPVELSYNDAIVQGKGVYIEELEKAIQARGLEVPQDHFRLPGVYPVRMSVIPQKRRTKKAPASQDDLRGPFA